jgi:tetratricopeptide (TPR) repeat protein
LRLLAYEEAVRLYQTALQALDLKESADEAARCEVLLALGDARARAGDFPQARESFLRAADIAGMLRMPALLAQAALGYGGRFVWEAGRGDPHLVRLLDSALTALGAEDSLLRVRVMARLAGGPLRDDRAREPRAVLSQHAVEMARRLGDPATLAYALDGRYAAMWWPENLEERLSIAAELVRVAQGARDRERALQGCHYRCLALLELGDLAGVSAELEAQAQLAEELRQPAHHWYVAVVRATLATFQGRFVESEQLIPQAVALGQRAHGAMSSVYHTLQLYALRREQGRLPELEPTVQRVAYDFPTYPVLRCVLAHLYAERGREREAREIFERLALDEFTGLSLDDEWVFSLTLLGDVAERLGDAARAATIYRLLTPYAARNAVSNPDMCVGSVARTLGNLARLTGQPREAARHLEDALAMNTSTGGRPWLLRTQLDYARLLLARDAPGDRERALELATSTAAAARDLGMMALQEPLGHMLTLAQTTPAPRGHARAASPSTNQLAAFRREGEYWSVAYEGELFRLKDAKGLRYLAHLLVEPGREFHVLDLVAEPGEPPPAAGADREPGLTLPSGDAGPILDAQAKSAYRRRLAELQEDLEEAEARGDRERVLRLEEERGFLLRHLAGAVGLGSRDRRALAVGERARVNVTRAVKAALLRIHRCSPALGRHLDTTIKTGAFCSYTPDPRAAVIWKI